MLNFVFQPNFFLHFYHFFANELKKVRQDVFIVKNFKGLVMVNQAYLDDKKIKDILTYISSMRHSEQIREMFFCSLNGMRSINFYYLQIKDIYNDAFKCGREY